jgi:hypothetical protein
LETGTASIGDRHIIQPAVPRVGDDA